MNRKTVSILMIAVVCGLGAMLVSSQMLAGGGARPVDTQEVVLASRDLTVEEVLKPEMLKLESLPKTSVPAGAFGSIQEVADRWVQIKMLEGEPILDKKLAPKGAPTGLIARIPKGKRAFAININEQTGVSGFVLPDHHVDLYQVQTAPLGTSRAVPVLQNVLVLASGTSMQTSVDRTIQARTVTVAVTPEQAAILTVAQSKGQISLALRSLNDNEVTPLPPEVLPTVSLTPPPPPPPAVPAPKAAMKDEPVEEDAAAVARHVTIYRGGRAPEKVRVDKLPEEGEATGLGFPHATDLAATPPPVAPQPGLTPVPR